MFEPLKKKGVELGIFISTQPLASQPPPPESVTSSYIFPLDSSEPTSRFLLFPEKPLFDLEDDPICLSPSHQYDPFDTTNVPLVSSHGACQIPFQELFPPNMATNGDDDLFEDTP